MLPPEFRASNSNISVVMSVKAPRKSILFHVASLFVTGLGRVKKIKMLERMLNGTIIRNATRQSHTSLIKPPTTAPNEAPIPKMMLPIPCHTPLLLRGMISEAKMVEIAVMPPPPIPATTRPKIIIHCVLARPQIRFPRAKDTVQNISPVFLDKMSVRRPLMG